MRALAHPEGMAHPARRPLGPEPDDVLSAAARAGANVVKPEAPGKPSRAERLAALDRERERLLKLLHRNTTRLKKVEDEARGLRVSFTAADRTIYDALTAARRPLAAKKP